MSPKDKTDFTEDLRPVISKLLRSILRQITACAIAEVEAQRIRNSKDQESSGDPVPFVLKHKVHLDHHNSIESVPRYKSKSIWAVYSIPTNNYDATSETSCVCKENQTLDKLSF